MHSKLMIDVNAMNNEVKWLVWSGVCGVETTMKTRENTRTG